MRSIFFSFLLFICFTGTAQNKDAYAILNAMEAQRIAWNNGDLET